MKVSMIFAALSVLLLTGTTSCKKKIYGCMDESAENYSPVATEDAKNCVYAEPEEVYSSTVQNVGWYLDGVQYRSDITWSAITQNVLDNGGLITYIRIAGNSIWENIPFTIFQSSTYSTSVNVSYHLGGVSLVWTDSDLTIPATPPIVDVKLVIVE